MDFNMKVTVVESGYSDVISVRTNNGKGTPEMDVTTLLTHARFLVEDNLKKYPNSKIALQIIL